jgi:hypothetical protein
MSLRWITHYLHAALQQAVQYTGGCVTLSPAQLHAALAVQAAELQLVRVYTATLSGAVTYHTAYVFERMSCSVVEAVRSCVLLSAAQLCIGFGVPDRVNGLWLACTACPC